MESIVKGSSQKNDHKHPAFKKCTLLSSVTIYKARPDTSLCITLLCGLNFQVDNLTYKQVSRRAEIHYVNI